MVPRRWTVRVLQDVFSLSAEGLPSFIGSQNLTGRLIKFDDFCLLQKDSLPVPKGQTLKWVGITEEGVSHALHRLSLESFHKHTGTCHIRFPGCPSRSPEVQASLCCHMDETSGYEHTRTKGRKAGIVLACWRFWGYLHVPHFEGKDHSLRLQSHLN